MAWCKKMRPDRTSIDRLLEGLGDSGKPEIRLVDSVGSEARRIGVFSSSFNPPTNAHAELVRRAAGAFGLDRTIALTGTANADKRAYESLLSQRVEMMILAFADQPLVSTGVSSHAFFPDFVDALRPVIPAESELHFVLGFDTFERVLDRGGRYINRYHRNFSNPDEAIRFLLLHSRLIVADRAGAGANELDSLVAVLAPELRDRVLRLPFPEHLAEISATEVRRLVARGERAAAVHPLVEAYIREHALYSD
jgi:nicotinic acid mononucleotide adenylyltransferase